MSDISDLTGGMRGLGQVQHISADRHASGRGRLDEAVRIAAIGGDHVWTVLTAHLITDPERAVAGDLMLDAESLVSASIGCYRCEQAYTPRLRHRRCPGDPEDGR